MEFLILGAAMEFFSLCCHGVLSSMRAMEFFFYDAMEFFFELLMPWSSFFLMPWSSFFIDAMEFFLFVTAMEFFF